MIASANRTNTLRWILCALCAVLACGGAAAQTVTGTITGMAADPSGAAVAGATVTLTNQRTGDIRTVSTHNDNGRFVFAALQPGTYTIKIEMTGFQVREQKNVVLSANENLALGDLTLTVGEVTSTVTIVSEGAKVETEATDLTARLTDKQIDLISTKGRDVTSLLRTVPGTSYEDDIESVGGGFGTTMPFVSGQRGRSTVVTINGLNASEPSGSNLLSMTVTQDSVGEVKILRNNYGAEYGNNGGAMVNIVTKGGSSEYHGSAYYYARNEALNANSWLNNARNLPRGLYRHLTWGFNVGGPVQIPKIFPNRDKNKLFFFVSVERPHTITPQDVRQVTVPSALERQGDFSQSFSGFSGGVPTRVFPVDPAAPAGSTACTAAVTNPAGTNCFSDPSRATTSNPFGLHIIPQARWNASGAALLNFFPAPNQATNPAANQFFNYIVQKSVDVPKLGKHFRVDFKPTAKDSFHVHGQTWTADNEGFQTSGWPGGTPPDANVWGISSHYLYKDNGITIGWTRIFTQTIVNEFSIGARHDSEDFVPSAGVVDSLSRATLNYGAPQLFPANNTLGTIPRATGWAGTAGRPANINWLDRWGETGNDYILPSFTDNFSITRGRHSLRFGVYFERMLNGEAPGGNWSGTFDFGSTTSTFTSALGNAGFAYANALLGNFNNYQESTSRPHTNLKRLIVQWYGQDQWKVNRQFSLNYGLRLGYASQWFQRDYLASNFDLDLWDPAQAPRLYAPICYNSSTNQVVAPPATAACASSQRRAIDPIFLTGTYPQTLPPGATPIALTGPNASIIGSIVPGSGNLNNGLLVQSDPNAPKGFKVIDAIAWEPRVGFAWDIGGRSKTVLRAMGGVYHAPRTGGGTTGGNLVNNPPFQRTLRIDFGNIANLSNLVGTALTTPSGLNAVEDTSHTPTIYNFQLGIQQEIGYQTVLEVSYVGSRSRFLGERRNINSVPDQARFLDVNPQNRNPHSAPPVITTTPATTTVLSVWQNGGALADSFLRPFRGYGDINQVTYSGTSNYNALQVQANRRYARGFQFGLAWTWSRTLDYANDDSSDINFGRPYRQFNYAPADFDQKHIFSVNYIWEVPRWDRWNNLFARSVLHGWTLSGMTNLVSGRPKSITVSYQSGTETVSGVNYPRITDFTGGEVNARAILACDPQATPGIDGIAPNGMPILIDTTCVATVLRRGEIGNTPRNFLRLPGVINFDLAMFKSFSLTERIGLQFRWETYNLFNHPNFRDIDGNVTFSVVDTNNDGVADRISRTSSTFGQPTSVRSPRVMQGSLRITF